jgi:hypothetical protein
MLHGAISHGAIRVAAECHRDLPDSAAVRCMMCPTPPLHSVTCHTRRVISDTHPQAHRRGQPHHGRSRGRGGRLPSHALPAPVRRFLPIWRERCTATAKDGRLKHNREPARDSWRLFTSHRPWPTARVPHTSHPDHIGCGSRPAANTHRRHRSGRRPRARASRGARWRPHYGESPSRAYFCNCC